MKENTELEPVQDTKEPAIFKLGKFEAHLVEPTIRRMREIKAEGFDIENADAVNKAYFELTTNEEKLKRVLKIIFIEEIPDEALQDIPLNVVKQGLFGFFGESGIVIL